jgi:hypothetical protein
VTKEIPLEAPKTTHSLSSLYKCVRRCVDVTHMCSQSNFLRVQSNACLLDLATKTFVRVSIKRLMLLTAVVDCLASTTAACTCRFATNVAP